MSSGLWVPPTASSTAGVPDGAVMEELMCRSLEDNAYSVQGFWLWQSRIIQQRRHREQNRRRPRSGEAEAMKEGEAPIGGPRSAAEASAERHAEEVRSYVSGLLHATGYPYETLLDLAEEPEERKHLVDGAVLADTVKEPSVGVANALDTSAAELVVQSQQPDATTTAAPAKVARVEAAAASSPAAPPMSALAKLVAKAKAEHNGPAVTVVPAPKNASLSEDLSAMLAARASASSATTAAARKRVQFADAPHVPSAHGKAATDDDNNDDEDFSVQIPGHATASSSSTSAQQGSHAQGSTAESTTAGGDAMSAAEEAVAAKHPSQMTRAEFLSQFKRAPRRGEIGQTAEDIAAAEELGYVMSGSRSVASRMYVDRVQRQLHEHEAAKLQQQFRKVEDERMDDQLVHGLAEFIMKKKDTVS